MITMEDASESLHVLLSQEKLVYETSDYLAKIHCQEQIHGTSVMDTSSSSSSSHSPKKRKSYDDDVNVVDQPGSVVNNDSREDDEGTSSTQINKHWREKICEWAYQGEYMCQ
jgi:hypothetical protein